MLLLLMLALLAMFAMLAVVFVVFTGSYRRSADRIHMIDYQLVEPKKQLNQALQIVVGGLNTPTATIPPAISLIGTSNGTGKGFGWDPAISLWTLPSPVTGLPLALVPRDPANLSAGAKPPGLRRG